MVPARALLLLRPRIVQSVVAAGLQQLPAATVARYLSDMDEYEYVAEYEREREIDR